jgi:hypothetical protein
MKLVFLSQSEAIQEFIHPDEYALNLPFSNLVMINPENPTLAGYQETFLNSFGQWTDAEKKQITAFTEKLTWLDLEVKIIKTLRTHALDITQTRKDIILVSGGLISEATFIHECYHVLSRKYPTLTVELSKLFGFSQVPEQTIKDPTFLLNPDALVCNYAISVIHTETQKVLLVAPYVIEGLGTGLKVVGEEIYLSSSETDYESLFENTSYTSHPEEICAEYFTLIQLGRCIFLKTPYVELPLKMYQEKLHLLGNKLGFICGPFPSLAPAQNTYVWTGGEE